MSQNYIEQTKVILKNLVSYPSISSDSNLDIIHYIATLLKECGADIILFKDKTQKKANLFATMGPKGNNGYVLSGHTDVVPVLDQKWSTDPFKMKESDGKLYGRGTCDMKGFIAACICLAQNIDVTKLHTPLHFCFTYDEETGCLGAKELVQELKKNHIKPYITIVGEPTEMRAIEGHKGCYSYKSCFKGLAGHASNPYKGVNAVEYAIRYAHKLLEMREELKKRTPPSSKFFPCETTLNIGEFSGGTAHNVIPTLAELVWEIRPVQITDANYVKQQMEDFCNDELIPEMRKVHHGSDIITHIISEIDGLIPVPNNKAVKLIQQLTGKNSTDLVAFGTEAGLFQSLPSSVVVCGPGSIEQAHKADEFIHIEQLAQCLDMLHKVGEKLTTP